ncbi:hypothetical protein [Maricaulis maris]|uniref:hypothetical protein n=1 Tax=Maricaulis maris TaxID=74318 RepID=UPI0026F2470B|nr:hypothetical protein [Maricaulis maris]
MGDEIGRIGPVRRARHIAGWNAIAGRCNRQDFPGTCAYTIVQQHNIRIPRIPRQPGNCLGKLGLRCRSCGYGCIQFAAKA